MVASGKDFALVQSTVWVFPQGIGRATAILTRRALYMFPQRAFTTTANTRVKTTFTIGDRPPYVAINELVAKPGITADQLDQQLGEWARQIEGPIVLELAAVKRIRIFNGWLRRGVAFSEKETGYDMRPKAVRPTKQEMPAFIELLKDRPGVELK
ncbi:MAG TPA: hypothetical protein VGG74_29965 [Kofleriaceae bacterium]|jgi:hypothetical protein